MFLPFWGGKGQIHRLLELVKLLLAGLAVFQVLLYQGRGVGGGDAVVVQGQQVLDDFASDFHSNASFIFILAR